MHLKDCILFLSWTKMKDSPAKIYSTSNSHFSILQNTIIRKILIFCFPSIGIKKTKPKIQFILTPKTPYERHSLQKEERIWNSYSKSKQSFPPYIQKTARGQDKKQPRFWTMMEQTDKKTCPPLITSSLPVLPITSHSVVQVLCQLFIRPA